MDLGRLRSCQVVNASCTVDEWAITSIFTPSSFLVDVLGPVLVLAPTPATEPSSIVAAFEESLFRGGMLEI